MTESFDLSTYAIMGAPPERASAERRSRSSAVRPRADAYLNLLPYGALVVSSKLALFRANETALLTLSRGDVLKLVHGRVMFTRAEYQRHILAYIGSDAAPGPPLTLRLECSRSLGASIVQIRRHPDQRTSLSADQFLIAIYQPAAKLIVAPDVLQAAYGLSAAEARVASEIARADRLTSVAQALDISTNTVRTHIKHIFRKLSVSTQAQLIQLLASGPRE